MRVRAFKTGAYRGAPVWPACTFTLEDPVDFDPSWMAPAAESPVSRRADHTRPDALGATGDPALERARAEHRRILRRAAGEAMPQER